ncbi:MAG: A/G-specific adenine glycosylase [Planctomycetota bacterium]
MSDPDPSALAAPLVTWFDGHQRELPWRGVRDAYRVWVSEVMLQQTQVETVKRYYEPFLARFPDVAALAAASEGEVLAAWQGLGFYRRARNLHRGAQQVVREHGGELPRDPAALGRLPGLGRYTVGAVLSLTFDQRLPILDGNVARVLARVFRVEGSLKQGPVARRLWALAEEVLPERRVGAFNEALMELGALVCRPTSPACARCPLAAHCGARAEGRPTAYPEPVPAAEVPQVERVCLAVVRGDGRFCLVQRPAEGLLARMWELPAREFAGDEDPATVARELAREHGARGRPTALGTAEHRFSHRHWVQHVYRVETRATRAAGTWVGADELAGYGVPTAARKALRLAGLG